MTPTEKAIEAMARAYGRKHGPLGATLEAELERQDKTWRRYQEEMETALSAITSLHPGIASLIEGTGVVVPKEPTTAMKRAGQIAGDNQLWKWRGLGKRGEGGGLDGMTSIIVEAFRAMLKAAEGRDNE